MTVKKEKPAAKADKPEDDADTSVPKTTTKVFFYLFILCLININIKNKLK